MADPYRYFRIEAREILEQLQKDILELESGAPAQDIVLRMLRLAHTLKGAARVVKQHAIGDASHAIEDVLVPVRDGLAQVTRDKVAALLSWVDAIGKNLAALSAPSLAAEATGPSAHGAPTPPTTPAWGGDWELGWSADPAGVDGLLDGVAEVSVHLGALRRHIEGLGSAQQAISQHAASQHVVSQLTRGSAAAQPRDASPNPLARVGSAGPIANAARGGSLALSESLATTRQSLQAHLEQAARELSSVRDGVERLRLVAAQSLFGALQRTARDAAHSLGKQLNVSFTGGDIRVEADTLQTVQRALVQVVRNAVAHGIESPTERLAQGKPAAGEIRIEVARRGKHIVFTCSDDGKGVDLAAVRAAAEQRGLLQHTSSQTDAGELLRLLLQGGMSTATGVSQVAGRGIGLDVVREAAAKLDANVAVHTQAQRGTQFELAVKAQISALDVLVMAAGGKIACIAISSVSRTLRVESGQLTRTSTQQTLLLDEGNLPIVYLSRVLRGSGTESTERLGPAALIKTGATQLVLVADRFQGVESVIVRALPELAWVDESVLGTCLDQEGNPRLVLDPGGLVAAQERSVSAQEHTPDAQVRILVIDDSPTTRMLEQSILESAGYDVDVATSGEDGLRKAALRRYALFLVDVEMPGIDGFTFIERTRQDPQLAGTPAILVTSRASPEDLERGRQVGASGHIVKNEFDQVQFLARVRSLVR